MNTNTIGLPVIVTIVFVILKLVGVIAWSWWWVLSPLWISFGLGLLIVGVVLLVEAIDDYVMR